MEGTKMQRLYRMIAKTAAAALLSCSISSSCVETEITNSWDETQIPPEEEIHGVCHSPFRDFEDPDAGIFPASWEVQEDLAIISHVSPRIRMYGNNDVLFDIPGWCDERQIECYPAAWLDSNLSINEESISSLVQIADAGYTTTKGLIVGNEALTCGSLSESSLINYMNMVNAETDLPVTTAENWDVWLAHPNLADAADFIMIHIHPYWAGINAADAAEYVIEKYNQVQAAYPSKRVVIGETGWPTKGDSVGSAVPSQANQSVFLQEFTAMAESEGIEYFIFEAFDEMWKKKYGEVEGNWGIWDSDRTQKQYLQSLGVYTPDFTPEAEFGCSPSYPGSRGGCNFFAYAVAPALAAALLLKGKGRKREEK